MLRRLLRRREAGGLLVLVGLMVLIATLKPQFATWSNAYFLSRHVAFTAIVALGVLFVILTRGIDLSVGSTVGLSGIVCGLAMAHGASPLGGVLAGLATGAAVGCVNGAVVAYLGVIPFIVTLGMLSLARGTVLVLTHGDSVGAIPESFIEASSADVLGVPMAVLVLGVVALTAHGVLVYTVYGRRLYAVGGGGEAADPSRDNVRRVKLGAYVVSGLLSAVTGVLFVARFRSAQATAGFGMELDAIAAAMIGGASLLGGRGSVFGVLIGASIVGVMRNGLALAKIPACWQELAVGGVLALAAVFDVLRHRTR